MRAQITFRNGVQIEADVEALETSRNGATHELVKAKWTTPDGWTRKLHTVDVGEILAIVMIKDHCSCERKEVGLPGRGEWVPGRPDPN